MKYKNLSALLLASVLLISCTDSGTTTPNPSATPVETSSASPSASASAAPSSSTSPSATPTSLPSTSATPVPVGTPPPGYFMTFRGNLIGELESPSVSTSALGTATIYVAGDQRNAILYLNFQGLSSDQTGAHIHGPASPGLNAPVLIELPSGQISNLPITLAANQFSYLIGGQLYINVHTKNNPNGEIRAQLIRQE